MMIDWWHRASWGVLCMAALWCNARAETRFEFSEPQMGVPFRIVMYAGDESTARTAARAAFDRISQLNSILSDYDSDSELSRLSRSSGSGRDVPIGQELWEVLSRGQELAVRSDGAFDVTVGPSVNLWRRARRRHELPEPDLLEKNRLRVGYWNLVLHPQDRSATLKAEGMRLDLGGIAKGFAADQALELLKRGGISRALVAADGDIRVGDPPPGMDGWQIGLATLDVGNSPGVETILLRNAAVSTSGDLSQRLEIGGVRYSHIVDPRSGIGLTDHSLVTVIAPDAMTSDSLATTVSVLGPLKGLELIEAFPGTGARILRQPQDTLEVHQSRRFAELTGSSRPGVPLEKIKSTFP
jgi:FAD:protein FMN transferase